MAVILFPANIIAVSRSFRRLFICATVGFADVTSANIVGYQTVNSPVGDKFSAFTVSFEDVANGSTVKIKELVKGTFTGKPNCATGADQIWLWDSANDVWIEYYFRRADI